MPDVDRLLGAIDAFEAESYSSDGDSTLGKERAFSIDLYLGKNVNPAPDGRSQVVDRAVYEVVNEIKPSLARIFAGGDDIVSITPVGPEDEEGSKQEADYINYQILQRNNWFEIFDTACSDALVTKMAYLYPYAEKRRQVELEKYEKQTPESLALIMQDNPEVVSQREYPDPDYQPQPVPVPDPMTGQPAIGPDGQPVMMVPPPPMLYDIEIRRTKVETSFCIDVLPPERCKVAGSTKTVQVSRTCPYFEYEDYPTISELRQDGYDVDDDIGQDEAEDSMESAARNQYGEIVGDDDIPNDPTMRQVKTRYVWVRHDYDDDGIAELQFCVIVGKTLLHREEVNRIPIGVLCPDPLPHRHPGQCPADTAGDLQQVGTVFMRLGIDNAQFAQNPMKFGDPTKVNLDDALVSRPGGFIRTKNGAIFGQDFGVLQIPDTLPSTLAALQFLDHLRQKRTGVSSNFQGLDANQLSNLQPGTVNQISSMAAQRVEQIARHFAPGMTETASILHELILKSGHKADTVKLRGKWVEVDPTQWRHNRDFKIAVGFAAGNKDAQVARLTGQAAMQKEAMMGGLRIVTEENIYNTALELSKANGFSNPSQFWTDPKTLPLPEPPQPDVTVMAMEQLKAQSALQVKQLDVEQKERDSVRDFEIKKAELATNAEIAVTTHREKLAHEQQASHFGAEKDAHMAQLNASLNPKNIEAHAKASEAQSTVEVLKAVQESNAEQTQAILLAIQELAKAMAAPRVIDRDKAGKAVGSRIAS